MGGNLVQNQPNTSAAGTNTKVNGKVKIIKRYQNRKLYDTQQSCYVTLDDIAKMIRNNEEVMVIDNKSKNDITAATLTQIIFESEKKASHYAPLFTLREIIQHGNGSISNFLAKLGAFPKEYMTRTTPYKEPVTEPKPIYEDIKQTLENRVASAAEKTVSDLNLDSQRDDDTPSLPSSNKSLSN